MFNDNDTTSGKSQIPLLKTADQYHAWKARVVDRCWALTGRDITAVTDQACEQAITKAFGQIDKEEVKVGDNWVGKCWLTLTAALHDDLLVKVAHVPRGHIHSLLTEISLALVLNSAEEVQPLRLELYGATMIKDGNSDLQTYIVYLLERVDDELIYTHCKFTSPLTKWWLSYDAGAALPSDCCS